MIKIVMIVRENIINLMNQTENKSTDKKTRYDKRRNNNQNILDSLCYEKRLAGVGVISNFFDMRL